MMGQLVELRTGQHGFHVQRAVLVRRQEGKIDAGHGDAGELDLRLLRRLLDALHRGGILAQVDLVLPLELVHQVVHDALVEVVSAQAVVARRGQNLDDIGVNVQNRYVEGAAAQVVDHDLLRVLLVHAVGQRRSGGLVDDALDVQAGNHARVLGGLALRVGEVGRNRDHGLRDRLAQIGLSIRLQFLKDHRRDLLGRILLSIDVDPVVAAHLALDGADGALTVGDGLTLGHLADQALSVLCKCDKRGRGARTLGIGDDDRLAALDDRDAGVGRAQIDSYDSGHAFPSVWLELPFYAEHFIQALSTECEFPSPASILHFSAARFIGITTYICNIYETTYRRPFLQTEVWYNYLPVCV